MRLFNGGPFVHELVGLVGAGGKADKVSAASVSHHGHIMPSIGTFRFDEVSGFAGDEKQQIAVTQQIAHDGFAVTLVGLTRVIAVVTAFRVEGLGAVAHQVLHDKLFAIVGG